MQQMTLLSQVTSGIQKRPLSVLLYGTAGIGKSTFASNAKNPIFLGAEKGDQNLNVSRFPKVTSWTFMLQALNELFQAQHNYSTLVIDTLDSLQPVLHQYICQESEVQSIERASGGYGKGYKRAEELLFDLRNRLEVLREKRGMNIIILCHADARKFNDPMTNIEYDRYELKLHASKNTNYGKIFTEWVDSFLFANYEVYTAEKNGKEKAVGSGQRVIYTEQRPAYDAKNRFCLPEKMELSYQEFVKYVSAFYDGSRTMTIQEAPKAVSNIPVNNNPESEMMGNNFHPTYASIRDQATIALNKIENETIKKQVMEQIVKCDEAQDFNTLTGIKDRINTIIGG